MPKLKEYIRFFLALARTGVVVLARGVKTRFLTYVKRSGAATAIAARWAAQQAASLARWARNARQLRLFILELAGTVLVSLGISMWSVPAAVIVGGLVLVAAVEVRPHVAPSMPPLPVPEVLLRAQAEQAARLLNNARFGVPEVDTAALGKLTRDDCERIISVARTYGSKP